MMMNNFLLYISFVIMYFASTTLQLTRIDSTTTEAAAASTTTLDSYNGPLLLVDPTRMCRRGTRKFRDSMNTIMPGKTSFSNSNMDSEDDDATTALLNSNGNSKRTQRQNYNKNSYGPSNSIARQRRKASSYCGKEADVMKEASYGAKLATLECQHQFKHRHWNCSSHPRSIKKILARDTRETAFIHAITAAGVTYAITKGCSTGKIQNCPCDRTLSGTKSKDGNWEWGGCGDNVHIGYKRSKDILDIKLRRQSDIRSLMMLHNNEAGRLAVRNHMRLICKCHGLSGSCTLKTCWQKVPTFREIGELLKNRFDGSAKVISGNDGKSVIPALKSIKQPEREDLIYFEDSVDFCKHNKKTGSLGTTGRVCNVSSMNVDSCDILCCGRGHFSKIVRVKEYCRCKFQWCCEVSCEICTMRKIITTCR